MSRGPATQGEGRDFAARHRFALILLWAQVPALAVVGIVNGSTMRVVVAAAVAPAAFALAAMAMRARGPAATVTGLGLVTAAGVAVGLTDGAAHAYVYFLLAILATSLYRRVVPLAVAVIASGGWLLLLSSGQPTMVATALIAAMVAIALLAGVGWKLNGLGAADAGSEAMFRLGFERAPIGMAVLKPSGEFLEVNAALGELLGYEPDSLVGTNLSRLIHGDDQPDLGEAWEEMGNSTTHRASAWMRCVSAGGKQVWGRFSLSLVPRNISQPAMVILQVEDATNSYEEQQRLENLVRGKDEFVAAVGDEIRAPLRLLIDLTNPTEPADVGQQENIPRIEAHAREIASIVDDLVVSARAESTPVSMVPKHIDAAELCREVLTAFPASIDSELTSLDIWADPALARQILRSLIGIAVRYGGPSVAVRTLSSGPDTLIEISDNGPEIPDGERERIFAGDLRSGQLVTRPATVGLSLTVGRHLARQMDGDIEYRRLDGRNLFEIRLPTEPLTEAPRPNLRPAGISA